MQILPEYISDQSGFPVAPSVASASDSSFNRELDRSVQEVRADNMPQYADAPFSPYGSETDEFADFHNMEENPYLFMADAPYNVAAEAYSPFAPQAARLSSKETEKLAAAMLKDGVPANVVAAVRELATVPGGPGLDQLLLTVHKALGAQGKELSKQEKSVLHTFSQKLQGLALTDDEGRKLSTLFQTGTAKQSMDQIMTALKGKETPLTLNREEMAAVVKGLNLPASSSKALMKLFENQDQITLPADAWHKVLGQASLDVDKTAEAVQKALNSLDKNAPAVFRDAARREELERQTALGEDRQVSQKRTLIEDKATQAAPGRDLSEEDAEDDKQSRTISSDDDKQNRASVKVESKQAQPAPMDEKAETDSRVKQSVLGNVEEAAAETIAKGGKPQIQALAQNQAQNQDENLEEHVVTGSKVQEPDLAESPLAQAAAAQSQTQTASPLSRNQNHDPSAQAETALNAKRDATEAEQFAQARNSAFEDKNGRNDPRDSRDSRSSDHSSESVRAAQHSAIFASSAQGVGLVTPQAATTPGTQTQHALPGQTQSQIEQAILSASKDGTRRLELALNPLDLGNMTIILSTSRTGEISAVIQPEKAETAALITQQLDQIKAELEHQGIKLEKVDVQTQLSEDSRQSWQGMDQHNASQEFQARSQQLERLRLLGRNNDSSSSSLAHDMQNMAHTARVAEQGLHIVA